MFLYRNPNFASNCRYRFHYLSYHFYFCYFRNFFFPNSIHPSLLFCLSTTPFLQHFPLVYICMYMPAYDGGVQLSSLFGLLRFYSKASKNFLYLCSCPNSLRIIKQRLHDLIKFAISLFDLSPYMWMSQSFSFYHPYVGGMPYSCNIFYPKTAIKLRRPYKKESVSSVNYRMKVICSQT